MRFPAAQVAGFLLQKELDYLEGAVAAPKRPFAAIVGGSKVSSKIGVIESLMTKVDKIVIGGGMVFTFLKARGLETGSSLVEEDQLELAKKLETITKEKVPSRSLARPPLRKRDWAQALWRWAPNATRLMRAGHRLHSADRRHRRRQVRRRRRHADRVG